MEMRKEVEKLRTQMENCGVQFEILTRRKGVLTDEIRKFSYSEKRRFDLQAQSARDLAASRAEIRGLKVENNDLLLQVD